MFNINSDNMKVKVCGMKYKENVEQIIELKPDYIGFIFYPASKRYITEDIELPSIPSDIKKVGVFVNSNADDIIDKVNRYSLDCIQLHGSEPPYFCRQMKRITCIIKAFGIDQDFDFQILGPYKGACDYFLFDTKTAGHGGSGEQFNWQLLKKYNGNIPFFLSGGLDLRDVEQIKELSKALPSLYGIDVNSRFEISPGFKDRHKLNELIQQIRNE
jgi:phosphoribosylanthranilate isomerase